MQLTFNGVIFSRKNTAPKRSTKIGHRPSSTEARGESQRFDCQVIAGIHKEISVNRSRKENRQITEPDSQQTPVVDHKKNKKQNKS